MIVVVVVQFVAEDVAVVVAVAHCHVGSRKSAPRSEPMFSTIGTDLF